MPLASLALIFAGLVMTKNLENQKAVDHKMKNEFVPRHLTYQMIMIMLKLIMLLFNLSFKDMFINSKN